MATSQQININKPLLIDDTQPLSCFIQNTETEGDHIVYIIKVQRGFDSKYSWQIKKRYNEFNELFNQLKVSNYDLPLPPKKAFGNMKKEFLSTRQIGLQVLLEKNIK
jgi:PX domain-containing protein kinase-like protein